MVDLIAQMSNDIEVDMHISSKNLIISGFCIFSKNIILISIESTQTSSSSSTPFTFVDHSSETKNSHHVVVTTCNFPQSIVSNVGVARSSKCKKDKNNILIFWCECVLRKSASFFIKKGENILYRSTHNNYNRITHTSNYCILKTWNYLNYIVSRSLFSFVLSLHYYYGYIVKLIHIVEV